MNPLELVVMIISLLLIIGWRLSWLATRLDRAHARAERTWAALDAALVRRAHQAAEVAASTDPATALLICDAAAVALEPDLPHSKREQAESALTHVLAAAGLGGIERETERVMVARRLHNDAVAIARMLRARRTVRLFRLAGHAAVPAPFEMAELGGPDNQRPPIRLAA